MGVVKSSNFFSGRLFGIEFKCIMSIVVDNCCRFLYWKSLTNKELKWRKNKWQM